MRTVLCLPFLLLALAVGCSQPAAGPEADSADATGADVVLVNAVCPLEGGKVDEAMTVEYQGETVGFCCADCLAAWNEMSDEEKAEKLAALDSAGDEADVDADDAGADASEDSAADADSTS